MNVSSNPKITLNSKTFTYALLHTTTDDGWLNFECVYFNFYQPNLHIEIYAGKKSNNNNNSKEQTKNNRQKIEHAEGKREKER